MNLFSVDTKGSNALFLKSGVNIMNSDVEEGNKVITQEMSQSEITEIISDHLIGIIKKQFDEAKKAYQEATKK